jgi:hypothetical protein
VEYYTPCEILIAARQVLGRIDLDPASSPRANEYVKAKAWYGIDPAGQFVDGLFQLWYGRVWMNHPFGRKEPKCGDSCSKQHTHHSIDYHGNAAWVKKLLEEYRVKNVTEALCITYACTSEAWFQPLLDYPMCFLSPRTNYFTPDGNVKQGVPKGSVITYLGPNLYQFGNTFQNFGKLHLPYVPNP